MGGRLRGIPIREGLVMAWALLALLILGMVIALMWGLSALVAFLGDMLDACESD